MSYNSLIMTKLIIFDCDGTLFDTRIDIADSVNYARRHFGLEELPINQVTGYVGNGVEVLAEKSFAGTDIPAAKALEKIMEFYSEHSADKSTPYPGVEGTLLLLEPVMAIVSNKPQALVEELLVKHGMDRFFSDVIGGDTFNKKKPDPSPLHYLLEKYGTPPEEAMVVGDHEPDIQMARNAGVRSVYCNYGFFGNDTLGADASIDRFPELLNLL